MQITSNGSNLSIVIGSSTTSLPKSSVAHIDFRQKWIRIWKQDGPRQKLWAKIELSNVTAPVVTSLTQLRNVIQGYLKNYVAFTVAAAQTTFDTTGHLDLNDNYKMFVDGNLQSFGHTRVGNVVTFAAATEGMEIIIEK